MRSLLLVEDSLDAFNLVHRSLGSGYEITWAKTLAEAFRVLNQRLFDLIALDVTLPDGDGYRLCSLIQADDSLRDIPIVFLTARNAVADRVLGFAVGADDYISKPVDPSEFKARIDSRLRKRDREMAQADVIRLQGIEINRSTQRVLALLDGTWSEVFLTPIELRLLLYLISSPNQVLHRDQILDAIWGENIHVYSRSVDTHVSKLRKKLGSAAECIASVHGTGYCFKSDEIGGSLLPSTGLEELAREFRI